MQNFWDIFLPYNISIISSKYDGKNGIAVLRFKYPDSWQIHEASFVKVKMNPDVWTLDKIE